MRLHGRPEASDALCRPRLQLQELLELSPSSSSRTDVQRAVPPLARQPAASQHKQLVGVRLRRTRRRAGPCPSGYEATELINAFPSDPTLLQIRLYTYSSLCVAIFTCLILRRLYAHIGFDHLVSPPIIYTLCMALHSTHSIFDCSLRALSTNNSPIS